MRRFSLPSADQSAIPPSGNPRHRTGLRDAAGGASDFEPDAKRTVITVKGTPLRASVRLTGVQSPWWIDASTLNLPRPQTISTGRGLVVRSQTCQAILINAARMQAAAWRLQSEPCSNL